MPMLLSFLTGALKTKSAAMKAVMLVEGAMGPDGVKQNGADAHGGRVWTMGLSISRLCVLFMV